MSDQQITALVLGLTLVGSGTMAHAQERGYYNRVTTSNRDTISDYSARGSVGRGGGFRAAAVAARAVIRADSLHPYSDLALQPSRNRETGIPRSSSWRQEPQPPDEPPPANVQTRSHTYFPTLRPGLAFQQPVRLTTTPYLGHICTCSRGGIIAGTGHHR